MRVSRTGNRSDHELTPRALAAMAEAARRSRERTGGAPPAQGPASGSSAGPVPGNGSDGEILRILPIVAHEVSQEPGRAVAPPAATQPRAEVVTPPSAGVPPSWQPSAPAGPPRGPSTVRRRSRELPPIGSFFDSEPVPVVGTAAGDPPPTSAGPDTGRPRHAARGRRDRDRILRRTVATVSVVLVAVLAALVGSQLTKDSGTGGRGATAPPSAGVTSPAGSPGAPTTTRVPPTTTRVPPATTTPTTAAPTTTVPSTTTTVPAAAPGGAPVLAALDPPVGTPGQSVVVTGSGFMSQSGHITAEVGGVTAWVSCPDQTTCILTMPPTAATTPGAPVVITTDSGTSNPLTFQYS